MTKLKMILLGCFTFSVLISSLAHAESKSDGAGTEFIGFVRILQVALSNVGIRTKVKGPIESIQFLEVSPVGTRIKIQTLEQQPIINERDVTIGYTASPCQVVVTVGYVGDPELEKLEVKNMDFSKCSTAR